MWNDLATSSAQTLSPYAYYAALNLLDARVLFSSMKISELPDPALRAGETAIERHHFFPQEHLRSLGIEDVRDTNQVANYALVAWDDNTSISAASPADYFPKYAERFNEDPQAWSRMLEHHALPEGWYAMDYFSFLDERRRLIANIICAGSVPWIRGLKIQKIMALTTYVGWSTCIRFAPENSMTRPNTAGVEICYTATRLSYGLGCCLT